MIIFASLISAGIGRVKNREENRIMSYYPQKGRINQDFQGSYDAAGKEKSFV
jgi:hypothetical protein